MNAAEPAPLSVAVIHYAASGIGPLRYEQLVVDETGLFQWSQCTGETVTAVRQGAVAELKPSEELVREIAKLPPPTVKPGVTEGQAERWELYAQARDGSESWWEGVEMDLPKALRDWLGRLAARAATLPAVARPGRTWLTAFRLSPKVTREFREAGLFQALDPAKARRSPALAKVLGAPFLLVAVNDGPAEAALQEALGKKLSSSMPAAQVEFGGRHFQVRLGALP